MKHILFIHPEGNINNNPNLYGIVEILTEKGYKVDVLSFLKPGIYQQNPKNNKWKFLKKKETVFILFSVHIHVY